MVWMGYTFSRTAACPAVESHVPTLRRPSWMVKRRPRPRSDQASPGRSRNGARVHQPHPRTHSPPRTKRIQAKASGGESVRPTFTATTLPPQRAERRRTRTTAVASISRCPPAGALIAKRPGGTGGGAPSRSDATAPAAFAQSAGVHSVLVKIGIVGFPQSGKTTLFNLLTGAQAAVSRAVSRGTLNVGVARVPDERVGRLSALFKPERTVYATVEVVDLAGFERRERAGLDVGDPPNAAA